MKTTYVYAIKSFIKYMATRNDDDARDIANSIQVILDKKQKSNPHYDKAIKRLANIDVDYCDGFIPKEDSE